MSNEKDPLSGLDYKDLMEALRERLSQTMEVSVIHELDDNNWRSGVIRFTLRFPDADGQRTVCATLNLKSLGYV